uniref:Uncharacterized protein n=1 Tax=Anguilla anguilla TaxID=7936 RepID=A0A0E9UPT8_ANGAN
MPNIYTATVLVICCINNEVIIILALGVTYLEFGLSAFLSKCAYCILALELHGDMSVRSCGYSTQVLSLK